MLRTLRKKISLIIGILLTLHLLGAIAFASSYEELRGHLSRRLSSGETQAALAKDLAVDRSTISRFMSKKIIESPKLLRNFKEKYLAKPRATPQAAPIAFVPPPSLIRPPHTPTSMPIPPISVSPVILAKEIKDRPFTPQHVKRQTRLKTWPFRKDIMGTEEKRRQSSNASIVIASRGFADSKDGQGTFYDHMTFQGITQYETQISFPLIDTSFIHQRTHLESYAKSLTHNLTFGETVNGKKLPPIITNSYEGGLLVIPGRMREREYEPTRAQHEHKIIQDALNRGQPILALCAGSWRLWHAYGKFSHAFTDENLVHVTDHAYSRMLNFSDTTNRVVYNVDVHGLVVDKSSFLAQAMGQVSQRGIPIPDKFPVNSVHWKAIDSRKTPPFLKVSATAAHEPDIKLKNRHSKDMLPEVGTAEAFEWRYGAPLLGIQWHPEGYYDADTRRGEQEHPSARLHKNLLKFMAQAGEAYAHKRLMLQELSALRK